CAKDYYGSGYDNW
nr:immunoglobulin heavy chain junction region [Macaca mulatta]MOV35595.1 immunoglobulin heavy chain junction region [Macaca mulatta]MOV35605.1 immunoglobulin heavy chain junction region [Macaca mulatta]MOV35614.1 immunoglobulin heavy chain junction region [Macaca mulatta]MOV35650.1 immunoglobulin heavy chain junction region [Macaca mulatta]